MSFLFSCNLGKTPCSSENMDDFVGRLINACGETYIVTEIDCIRSEKDASFVKVSFYIVKKASDGGRPYGQWVDAAGIAEPGTTFPYWDHRTDYRESRETCRELARLAREADVERRREQEEAEKRWHENRRRCEKLLQELTPEGAKSYILAEYLVKESMFDNFSHVSECVLIGFSQSERNSFSEMRKAAACFPPASHLATGEGIEYRQKCSRGTGDYLAGRDRASGWRIRKRSLKQGLPRLAEATMDFSYWTANH